MSLSITQSQGVNVLRWTALVFGIGYGFSRQRNITSNAQAAEAAAAYQHKVDLIEKAKLEWKKKTLPPQAKTGSGDIITDPEDKNFDFEAYMLKVEEESK